MNRIAHDLQGVRRAALELMEEALTAEEREAMLDRGWASAWESPDPAAAVELIVSGSPQLERKLPAGYYEWAAYLFWLEQVRQIAPEMPLAADELDGLVMLTHVRAAFEHEHPPCAGCGARQQTRFATRCRACGHEFRRRAS